MTNDGSYANKYELQTPLRVSKLDVVSKHTVHITWSTVNFVPVPVCRTVIIAI